MARGPQASEGARSNVAAGLRASLGFGRWLVAEAEILGLATEDRTYRRKARILGYRFNALANLMAGDFRPFVLVGAGAIQVATTDAEGNSGLVHDTDGEVHVGVGFEYRLVDLLSVRGDARVMQLPSKESWGLTTDVEATLGAVVTFGGGAGSRNKAQVISVDAPRESHEVPPGTTPPIAPPPARPAVLPSSVDVPKPAEPISRPSEREAMPVATNARSVSGLLERAKEIKFEGTTNRLAKASLPFIEELAAALVSEPGVRLEIVSHTADSGDAKKDLTLSKRRAETVKYSLVVKGASTDQLVATGRGSEDPIVPNITRSGRMRNERVELHRVAAQAFSN